MKPWRVCVLGAGIIGLSSAHAIANMDHGSRPLEVTIVSDRFFPDITSNVAAGLWEPYSVGGPEQMPMIRKWATATWEHLKKLNRSAEAKEAGTCLAFGYQLMEKPTPDFMHGWRELFFDLHDMRRNELEMFPGFKYGYGYTTQIANPSKYIPWLTKRTKSKGVKFVKKKIDSLLELSEDYDIIVNSSGAGASMFGDDKIRPGRGQIIQVHAPWVKHFVIASEDGRYFYIFPCPDFVVLGGTNQRGDWFAEPRESDREEIWKGCCRLIPSLKDAKVLEDKVGHRPMRDTVRIESEQIDTPRGKKWVVHNYGHGGSGVTTHWGCGQEAASLVKECLDKVSLTSKL